MNHNQFDFDADLVAPFAEFLQEHGIILKLTDDGENNIYFPDNLFVPPVEVLVKEKIQLSRMSFLRWLIKKFG